MGTDRREGEAGLKSTLTDVLHSRPLGNCHGLIGIEHPRNELRPVKGHGQGAVKGGERKIKRGRKL